MKKLLILLLAIAICGCKSEDAALPSKIENSKIEINTDNIFDEQKSNQDEKVNSYNEFISRSYPAVFNNMVEFGNFVYSPYSYKMALEGLGKITHYFDGEDYFGYATHENLEKNLPNLNSETAIILNKNMLDTKSDEFLLADFPEEAEKLSQELQKSVLGHVLLEPEYEKYTASVIVNATKFHAKWDEEFNKAFTEKREFKTLDGKTVEKDTMYGNINIIAIDNEEVSVGRKYLEGGGFVYFVAPKKYDADSLQKISEKIPYYIEEFKKFEEEEKGIATYYDAVELFTPKFNISSNIDLLKVESKAGRRKIKDPFDLVEDIINKTNEKIYVQSILQVANMMIDEKEVKAEAVTEMKDMATEARPPEKILTIMCDHPHFVVATSGKGVISFIAFIGK